MNPLTTLPRFELKYCERCAGLWLRPKGTITPYCPACEHWMAELPMRRLRNQRNPALRTYVPAAVSLLAMVATFAHWQQAWIAGWTA